MLLLPVPVATSSPTSQIRATGTIQSSSDPSGDVSTTLWHPLLRRLPVLMPNMGAVYLVGYYQPRAARKTASSHSGVSSTGCR